MFLYARAKKKIARLNFFEIRPSRSRVLKFDFVKTLRNSRHYLKAVEFIKKKKKTVIFIFDTIWSSFRFISQSLPRRAFWRKESCSRTDCSRWKRTWTKNRRIRTPTNNRNSSDSTEISSNWTLIKCRLSVIFFFFFPQFIVTGKQPKRIDGKKKKKTNRLNRIPNYFCKRRELASYGVGKGFKYAKKTLLVYFFFFL